MLQIIHVGKQSRRIRQEEEDCEEGSSAVYLLGSYVDRRGLKRKKCD